MKYYETSETDKTNEKTEIKKGAKENLYDRIPLTLKQLDIIIAVMIALFVVFFVIGVLRGKLNDLEGFKRRGKRPRFDGRR